MIETSSATAWFVYAVVDADAPELDAAVAGVPGVADGDVEVMRAGPLAAIVSAVPLDDFEAGPLREHLEDRAWLEEKARAHAEVVQRVFATTAVVPLRFGAIYHEPSDIAALLDDRQDEFRAELDLVRGRVELGVKGWLIRPSGTRDTPTETSGHAYLARRHTELQDRRQSRAEIGDAARAIHTRLAARAIASAVNRPQPRALTGRREEMILNAAYLVRRDDTALLDEVAVLAAVYPEIELEVTGPWPAHNFVGGTDGAE